MSRLLTAHWQRGDVCELFENRSRVSGCRDGGQPKALQCLVPDYDRYLQAVCNSATVQMWKSLLTSRILC